MAEICASPPLAFLLDEFPTDTHFVHSKPGADPSRCPCHPQRVPPIPKQSGAAHATAAAALNPPPPLTPAQVKANASSLALSRCSPNHRLIHLIRSLRHDEPSADELDAKAAALKPAPYLPDERLDAERAKREPLFATTDGGGGGKAMTVPVGGALGWCPLELINILISYILEPVIIHISSTDLRMSQLGTDANGDPVWQPVAVTLNQRSMLPSASVKPPPLVCQISRSHLLAVHSFARNADSLVVWTTRDLLRGTPSHVDPICDGDPLAAVSGARCAVWPLGVTPVPVTAREVTVMTGVPNPTHQLEHARVVLFSEPATRQHRPCMQVWDCGTRRIAGAGFGRQFGVRLRHVQHLHRPSEPLLLALSAQTLLVTGANDGSVFLYSLNANHPIGHNFPLLCEWTLPPPGGEAAAAACEAQTGFRPAPERALGVCWSKQLKVLIVRCATALWLYDFRSFQPKPRALSRQHVQTLTVEDEPMPNADESPPPPCMELSLVSTRNVECMSLMDGGTRLAVVNRANQLTVFDLAHINWAKQKVPSDFATSAFNNNNNESAAAPQSVIALPLHRLLVSGAKSNAQATHSLIALETGNVETADADTSEDDPRGRLVSDEWLIRLANDDAKAEPTALTATLGTGAPTATGATGVNAGTTNYVPRDAGDIQQTRTVFEEPRRF